MRSAPLQKRNCHNNWQSVISDSDEWTHDNLFLILSQPHTIMLFQIHENLFLMHSQPTFLHIIIPSWQLTASMHQIGSLICNKLLNKHDKLITSQKMEFECYYSVNCNLYWSTICYKLTVNSYTIIINLPIILYIFHLMGGWEGNMAGYCTSAHSYFGLWTRQVLHSRDFSYELMGWA